MAAVGLVGVLGAAGDLGLLSKVAVGPGPSYGSSEVGLLNIFIISCDMPIGLFGWLELVLAEAEPVVEDADLADVCEPAGARADVLVAVDGDRFDCGPVRALEEAEVLGAVGKKLSELSTIGENLILVCLVSLQASFSFLSSSEVYTTSGFLYQSGSTGKLEPCGVGGRLGG